jgi:hypothetical protein
VDDGVGVHVGQRLGDLRHEAGDRLGGQSLLPLAFVETERFVEIIVGGEFADEVDEVVVVETAVETGNVGVVHEQVDLYLPQ